MEIPTSSIPAPGRLFSGPKRYAKFIKVTRQDVESAEQVEGRVYITVDTPMYGRPRAWMGPESFQALRDVVGQDGEA